MTSDFNTESKLQGRQLTDCVTVVTVCLWLDAHKDQDDWLLLYLNCQSLTHSLLLTMTYDKWLSSVWLIDSLIQWNDFSIQIYFHFIMTLHSGWHTVTVTVSFDAGLLLPVPVSCSDRFRLKFTSLNEWKLFDDDDYHSSFSSFSLFWFFHCLIDWSWCHSESGNWLLFRRRKLAHPVQESNDIHWNDESMHGRKSLQDHDSLDHPRNYIKMIK